MPAITCPKCGRPGYGPYVLKVRSKGRVYHYLYVLHEDNGKRSKCYLGRVGFSQPRVSPERVYPRVHNVAWVVEPVTGTCAFCGRVRPLEVHLTCYPERGSILTRDWEHIYICAECARRLPARLRAHIELILALMSLLLVLPLARSSWTG